MKNNKKHLIQLWIQDSSFVILLLLMFAFITYCAYQYDYFQDVTHNKYNTTSDDSIAILNRMKAPINIKAFVTDDHAYRDNIRHFINKYRRTKSNIELTFINPATESTIAQEFSAKVNGELVVEYQNRTEHILPPYQEEDFTNLLMHLAKSGQKHILVLDANDERDFSGKRSHDMGLFGQEIISKGYTLSTGTLPEKITSSNDLPLLVIAGTQNNATSQAEKIKHYIDAGANLIWLIDNGNLGELSEVANHLGLVVSAGVVIDSALAKFGGNPTATYAAQYGDHPATKQFKVRTLFPEARQVKAYGTYQNGWKVQDLVHVAPNGWLENSSFTSANKKTPPTFNPKEDVAGPINIALAMERTYEDKGQRIVIVGNVDFLSNQFIKQGGNLELGLNMIHWLTGDNIYLKIPPKTTKDAYLNINADSHYKIVFMFFQILLPLIILTLGMTHWWLRRKA